MRTFTDSKSRSWVLAVDGWTIRQIKRDTGYLILNAIDPEKTLFNDMALVVEVLWVLCKKQAENNSVSEEDFCRAIHGDSLEEATEQLGMEVIDFLANRANARLALQKFQEEIDSRNLSAEASYGELTLNSPEFAALHPGNSHMGS